LATVVAGDALVEAIVSEMAEGINCAVEFWMGQIESALHDPRLATLGRMHAIQEVVNHYRNSAIAKVSHDGHAA
jgi:hypothetical protein